MTDTPHMTTGEALAIVFAYQKAWPHALPPMHRKVYDAAVLHLHGVGTRAMVREVDAMKPNDSADAMRYALKDSPLAKSAMGALIDELNDRYGRPMPNVNTTRHVCEQYKRQDGRWACFKCDVSYDHKFECPQRVSVVIDTEQHHALKAREAAIDEKHIPFACRQVRHPPDMYRCDLCCVAYPHPFRCVAPKYVSHHYPED